MLRAVKLKTLLQLVAIALHSFGMSAFLVAALPRVGDRLSLAKPLRASQLATFDEFTDRVTLIRGVKRSDIQSPTTGFASEALHPNPVQRSLSLPVSRSDQSRHRIASSLLSIRSPPSVPSR